jgi:hypothetical protein
MLAPGRARRIEKKTFELGKRLGVRVYRYGNSGNHVHMVVLPKSRKAFHAFLRALSGILARICLTAEKGQAKKMKFFDARPYTRILEWGREFTRVGRYVVQNAAEGMRFVTYKSRGSQSRARAGPVCSKP